MSVMINFITMYIILLVAVPGEKEFAEWLGAQSQDFDHVDIGQCPPHLVSRVAYTLLLENWVQ